MNIDYKFLARSMWEEFERIQFGDKRGIPPIFGNMEMAVIDLSTARESEELRFYGDFLFADSDTTGTVYVQINGSTMPKFPFKASTGIQGFPYRTLSISNAAQAGKTVHLWHGYGAKIIPPNQDIASISSITNPINLAPGDARYYRFGDYEAQQSESFIGGSPSAAVAAQVGFVQLFNPAASGKIIYVDDFSFWEGTAADRFELRTHNAAIGAGVATLGNKRIGGAAGVAQVRFGTSAAIPGTLVGVYAALANTLMRITPKAPIVLPEGFGIHINSFTANVSVGGTFEWREKTL